MKREEAVDPRRLAELERSKSPDRARWGSAESYDPEWATRSELAASFVPSVAMRAPAILVTLDPKDERFEGLAPPEAMASSVEFQADAGRHVDRVLECGAEISERVRAQAARSFEALPRPAESWRDRLFASV